MKTSILALILIQIPYFNCQLPLIPHGLLHFASSQLKKIPFADLQKLVSSQCALETGVFLNSLSKSIKILDSCQSDCQQQLEGHLFALKQLDSFGKLPSGISQWSTVSEGSYGACREVDGIKYETNFCYLSLVPDETCPKIDLNTEDVMLRLGVCIPKSCSSNDVAAVFNALSPVPLTACRTYCVKEPIRTDFWFWTFVTFMFFVLFFCCTATLFDWKHLEYEREPVRFRVLRCFSLYSNVKSIFKMEEEVPGVHLKGIHSLKFLAAVWVIVGHSPINFIHGDVLKPISEAKTFFWNHLMLDATYAVDVFYLVTGVLLGFTIFKRSSRGLVNSEKFWRKVMVTRYIRLLSPHLPWLGVFTFGSQFIRGSLKASLFNFMDTQAETCRSTWWYYLLMIQNFFRLSDTCYGTGWYVASDFQLHLLAPLLIVPLVKSQKDGLKMAAFLVSGSLLTVFFVFWWFELPPVHYAGAIEHFLLYIHQQTFSRIPTFVIGVLVGKSLALNKTPSETLRRNAGKCWLTVACLVFVCFYGKLLVSQGPGIGPIASAAHHIVFHWILWSLVVVWTIYACQFSLGSPVTALLTNRCWQPLGRLSYCVYVTHWWLMYIILNVSDQPLHYTSAAQVFVQVTIPTVVMVLPVALVWSAMFEVSIARLIRL